MSIGGASVQGNVTTYFKEEKGVQRREAAVKIRGDGRTAREGRSAKKTFILGKRGRFSGEVVSLC